MNEQTKFSSLTILNAFMVKGKKYVECQCDCGNRKDILWQSVRRGDSRSCGCKMNATTHGLSGTPGYKAWEAAKRRCTNPKDKSYSRYGALGIRMHPEWMDGPEGFIEEIGPRPSDEHSVDRIDVLKGYEPGNLRWATKTQQGCNKRNNRILTINGEKIALPDASRRWGVPIYSIRNRIKRGWPDDQAAGVSPRTR